ncbi:hypothetical protein EC988_002840, partial [Linderina pennispora]
DDESDVRDAYAYLYPAKDSIGKGSWVYKNSIHELDRASSTGSSTGTGTPFEDAVSEA